MQAKLDETAGFHLVVYSRTELYRAYCWCARALLLRWIFCMATNGFQSLDRSVDRGLLSIFGRDPPSAVVGASTIDMIDLRGEAVMNEGGLLSCPPLIIVLLGGVAVPLASSEM